MFPLRDGGFKSMCKSVCGYHRFLLLDYTPTAKNYYSRCLSESDVAKFKEKTLLAFNSVSCLNVKDDSYAYFESSQTDHLVDSAAGSLGMTLDSTAPLKKKLVKHSEQAPWYNPETRKLKHALQN